MTTDLAIYKSASTNSVQVGQQMQFSLTFSNAGPASVSGAATVTDLLPGGFEYVSSSGNGSYNNSNGAWTVVPGALGNTNLLTINVQAVTAGTYTNTATITGFPAGVLDLNTNNNSASVSVTVVNPPSNCLVSIACPSNIVVTSSVPTVVNFSVSASDSCGGELTVTSEPPSGSTFPIGTTTVTNTAYDSNGTNTCSFTVTVVSSSVILDDTWADGVRTIQNLPSESAWFVTTASDVTTGPGFMSLINTDSSSQWTTYFTPAGSPVRLNVGDSLTIRLSFTPVGVGASNTSKNLRFGIYDSSAGTRVSTDTAPNGTSYAGYAFFSNFGATWGNNTGLQLLERTNTSDSNLLSVTTDYSSLGSGGHTTPGSVAFSNGVLYQLTLTFTHTANSQMSLTATYSGGGLANTFTTMNSLVLVTNFDTLVIRPSSDSGTATN